MIVSPLKDRSSNHTLFTSNVWCGEKEVATRGVTVGRKQREHKISRWKTKEEPKALKQTTKCKENKRTYIRQKLGARLRPE